MPSCPGYRPMGCLLVSCYPGDGQRRNSQEVEDSPDVVISGEGSKQLHYSGQVLLSTRQREDKSQRVSTNDTHNPLSFLIRLLPGF